MPDEEDGPRDHAEDAATRAAFGTVDQMASTHVGRGIESAARASTRGIRLARGACLSGRFTITAAIGAGGMGEVYEAIDETTKRTVAVKCLPRLEPEALLMFKREFRLLSDLYHPSLARLGELGSDGDLWFFTMERVHGEDFVTYAKRHGQGALRRALVELGAVLAFLHREGRVHRDIKPHNVLVEPNGRVVVLDFGLVRESVGFDGAQSVTQGIRGTALYMAPEQAMGTSVGAPADFYAVGAMLYEVLVGRPPFEGATLAVLIDKQTKVPPSPASLVGGVPADLDALTARLLLADPAARAGAEDVTAIDVDAGAARLDAEGTSARTPSLRPSLRAERGSGARDSRSDFVGRGSELASLGAAFVDSTTSAVTVLLEGESGVGKSALARRFGDDARARGALVLTGRCFDRENVPYKVLDGVIDSLARQLSRLPKEEAAACVPRHREAAAMLRTFPVLRTVEAFDRVPEPTFALAASEHRGMLFSALRELLERLGSLRPIVITVDDLQWADADSYVALSELLLANEAPPVLWIFTVRPGAAERFRIGSDVRMVAVRSLDRTDALALAATLGCAGDAASVIVSDSGGHPLFLREMSMRASPDGPPLSLDDTIAERIAALHADARALVEIVALAGCPLPVDVALAAAGLVNEEASRAIAITRAEFLVRAGEGAVDGTVEPYHDRVRETVIGRLDDEATNARRGALAAAMEGSALAERRPDVHAGHLAAAGRLEEASDAYVRAAREAARVTAFDAAAIAFRTALSIVDHAADARAALLEALGEALANAGRPFEASDAWLDAASSGPVAHAQRRRQRAGIALLDTGNLERARAVLEPILRTAGESWPRAGTWFWIRFGVSTFFTPWYRWRARRARFANPDASRAAIAHLMLDIGIRLVVIDHFFAHWFCIRAIRAALRSESADALGRASAYLYGVSGSLGHFNAEWDVIAARCEQASSADAWTLGWRALGEYIAQYFGGTVTALQAAGARFEEHASRVPDGRFAAERLLVSYMMFWSDAHQCRFDRAASVRAASREADRRGDPLASIYMGEQCYAAWLVIADLRGTRDVLDEGLRTIPPAEPTIRDFFRLRAELQLGLIEPPAEPARLWDEMRRELGSVLMWTESGKISAPWNAMYGLVLAMRTGRDEAKWLAAASELVRTLVRPANVLLRSVVFEAHVACTLAGRVREPAIASMREAVAIAREAGLPGLDVIYSHRLGRFVGDAEGATLVDEAERTLALAGVRDPRLFAMLWAPLPEDDFSEYRARFRANRDSSSG